jgi:acetyltransferase-like isoleucine patch superfamily enzyme
MKHINHDLFPKCTFGENVNIYGDDIVIKDGCSFGNNVEISANNIYIGFDCVIQDNTKIKALKDEMEFCYLGDNTFIGFNTQILVPYFQMDDYSQVHNHGLLSGYQPLKIGYNCWIGQNVILNSFEKLTIGNNVRMGGCQIWTHVASGELLEGCTFFGSKPVIIEDNVWLMGFGHTVTPGTILRKNSIIMPGSVVTKSTEPYHVYSGIPAINITSKLKGWRNLDIDKKWDLLRGFINEFTEQYPQYKNKLICTEAETEIYEMLLKITVSEPLLIFVKQVNDFSVLSNLKHTWFDLNTKQYKKNRTEIEINWIKFSVGYMARFIPFNKPLLQN